MNNKCLWMVMCALLIGAPVFAQDEMQEVVVTGMRSDSAVPGTSLKRAGDFILLSVQVSNDSREEKLRKDEITATLRAMLAAAGKDKGIELSVIGDNNLVLPLKLDSATLSLVNGKRSDTTQTTINVKTRIPATPGNSSALVARLRDFVTGIKPVGRTLIDDSGDFEISIVNPAQYRDRVIELFAADVKKVTAALGADYKVVAKGIDHPIQWVRDGMLEVTIFVPYTYDVLPPTVTSYMRSGE
ncbi:MAG TPA: hypothetical protein VGQ27_05460 [Steroidobacteraceae bacterium]|jgi:hypothetical protein|nr:hypothetical protein [Steroidobacteraceae bacterium]